MVVKQSDINKKVSVHTFFHSFATHFFRRGTGVRAIQPLLDRVDVEMMIYIYELK